jgi:hypothetical protein
MNKLMSEFRFFQSHRRRNQRPSKPRPLSVQPLESRRVLAASLGWDGPGLGSAELTYHIANSPSSLTQAETNAAIETALDAWSSAADITFTATNQSGLRDSIDISFTAIDGVGGTLAQAYFPDDVNPARIAGDVQFDLSDAWEVGNSTGNQAFDLVYVAVHEIGHSLGLDHTSLFGSALAPFVSLSQSFSSLASVDVAAIQGLYAAADGETTTETPVDEAPVDETDHSHDRHHHHSGVFNVGLFGKDAKTLITRFDTDDDASLSEDEVSERLWAKISSADTDADGDVSFDELDALKAQRAADQSDADPTESGQRSRHRRHHHRAFDEVFSAIGRAVRRR